MSETLAIGLLVLILAGLAIALLSVHRRLQESEWQAELWWARWDALCSEVEQALPELESLLVEAEELWFDRRAQGAMIEGLADGHTSSLSDSVAKMVYGDPNWLSKAHQARKAWDERWGGFRLALRAVNARYDRLEKVAFMQQETAATAPMPREQRKEVWL